MSIHDTALRCPACNYDLRGLPQNLCPECGSAFDPDAILASRRGPRPTPFYVRVIGVVFSLLCVFVFLPALEPPGRSVGMLAIWTFAGLAAAFLGSIGKDPRRPGGLLLLFLAPTVLLSLTPLPEVCISWCAAAVGTSAGFAMLMRSSRRSPGIAALSGVALVCLLLGPKYLYEDFPWWWGGFHWSNWYNMTAAQSVALGASLTAIGIGCAATAIATVWNRRAASQP